MRLPWESRVEIKKITKAQKQKILEKISYFIKEKGIVVTASDLDLIQHHLIHRVTKNFRFLDEPEKAKLIASLAEQKNKVEKLIQDIPKNSEMTTILDIKELIFNPIPQATPRLFRPEPSCLVEKPTRPAPHPPITSYDFHDFYKYSTM